MTMATCPITTYLERMAHDKDCVRSTNSQYVAEMTKRQLPIRCELAYSSKYHNIERPHVLYTWGNSDSEIPGFLEDPIADDAAQWGVPVSLYEQLKALLFSTAGTCLWLLPPRNDKENAEVLPGAIYFEFGNNMFGEAYRPALRTLLSLVEKWYGTPKKDKKGMLETLERVLVEADVQGFGASWNTQGHRVVGTDVYHAYSLRQRTRIMETIDLYCPARGRLRLVEAMDQVDAPHGTVFMKRADTGAFSAHIRGLSWDKMRELEQAFSPGGLMEYLRHQYVKPPKYFSMCYTADSTPYCSAYVQHGDMCLCSGTAKKNQWIES